MATIACFCGTVFTPMFGPPVCPGCGGPGPDELDIKVELCEPGDCRCGGCPDRWEGD